MKNNPSDSDRLSLAHGYPRLDRLGCCYVSEQVILRVLFDSVLFLNTTSYHGYPCPCDKDASQRFKHLWPAAHKSSTALAKMRHILFYPAERRAPCPAKKSHIRSCCPFVNVRAGPNTDPLERGPPRRRLTCLLMDFVHIHRHRHVRVDRAAL